MKRSVPMLFLALLLAVPVAAQIQQATALFAQGDYEHVRRLLQPLSDDPQALLLLGRIALIQNDPDRSAELLEKAVARKPEVAEYHYWLGNAYGAQAQEANVLRQASLAGRTREQFERAVQLDPNLVDARFSLIDFYIVAPAFMGGSEEKALQQAAEIRKRDPFNGHRAFARIYGRQKKADLARKEWQDAVHEQPDSSRAHAGFGAFLGTIDKNYKAAFEELETAAKLDPENMVVPFRIGQIAAMSGANAVRGEASLKQYLAYHPAADEPEISTAHYYLGMLYEKQGKKAQARQSYAAAVKIRPKVKAFTAALKRVS